MAAHSSNEVALDEIIQSGVRGKPDLALASLDARKLSVLVRHYHDDDVSGPDALVDLALRVNGWDSLWVIGEPR